MNNRRKGLNRDRQILLTTEKWKVLDTDQYRVLFFNDIKSGKRKAQHRLKILYEKGKLARDWCNDKYGYYLPGNRPGKIRHAVDTNWIRLWFESGAYKKDPQFKYNDFKKWCSYEDTYYKKKKPLLRADGFVHTFEVVIDGNRFVFIEMDEGTNTFDKIEQYQELMHGGYYEGWWWVELTQKFPIVLIVTTGQRRLRNIQNMIKERVTPGKDPIFRVRLLDDIKKGVLATCKK